MWKFHVLYESRRFHVIITLGKKLYRIPKTLHVTIVFLIIEKQCKKVISQTRKLILFMVHFLGEKNIIETSTKSMQNPYTQQKQVDNIVEAYKDIFTTPVEVPLHCQVKNSINLIPGKPLSNALVYKCSLMENEERKFQFQEVIQIGHI